MNPEVQITLGLFRVSSLRFLFWGLWKTLLFLIVDSRFSGYTQINTFLSPSFFSLLKVIIKSSIYNAFFILNGRLNPVLGQIQDFNGLPFSRISPG